MMISTMCMITASRSLNRLSTCRPRSPARVMAMPNSSEKTMICSMLPSERAATGIGRHHADEDLGDRRRLLGPGNSHRQPPPRSPGPGPTTVARIRAMLIATAVVKR